MSNIPPDASSSAIDFDCSFRSLKGFSPFSWQRRLYQTYFERGELPGSVDVPTGLGKTSVIALWLIARANGARLPRRLVYVVDRRAVVDQATDEAENLRKALEGGAKHLKAPLGLGERQLPISTLRGAHVDNREWLNDPAAPAVVVGTVDMIGSRLLFEGYGVGRKMRPYQAGLLGIDALVVLDEAHLVPPFGHLLRAIERGESFRPRDEEARSLLPGFAVLPLSATQRDFDDNGPTPPPFRLEEEDRADPTVTKRLDAPKRLRLVQLKDKDHDKQLAHAAWDLATRDNQYQRVAIFCDRRDKSEEGAGPSAQGVKEQIEELAKGDKRQGRSKVEIHPIELLVGARRVHEREEAAKRLRELGFIGKKAPLQKPAILIATSAGEVGVDIDADHMVCDLVAWERMAQRFGRVNRRGEGEADVQVFWSKPSIKDTKAPTEKEKRASTAFASKAVIENLPRIDDAWDASPGALSILAERARKDAAFTALVDTATTPEPLRPALSRALVDAWSMTSLETHTGRPDVAPWLRGWVDEAPRTTVIWRTHLPIRRDAAGHFVLPGKVEINAFFDAAPPHESEKLETETYRVAKWLQDRASELLKIQQNAPVSNPAEEDVEDDAPESQADEIEATGAAAAPGGMPSRQSNSRDIIALSLSQSGDFADAFTLGDLINKRGDKNQTDKFQSQIMGKILIVDANVGGLKAGLLDEASAERPETADTSAAWSEDAGFRVRVSISERDRTPDGQADNWRFEDAFELRRNDDGVATERLIIEHFKDAAQGEEARSISNPQELAEHQDWAKCAMLSIAQGVDLGGVAADALAIAASLHDEGKKADRWQRAFKAPRDVQCHGLSGPLAKTRGPINQAILGGYRHEFGSLPHLEEAPAFKALPEDWRDLSLHLVAAHHGKGRPVIGTLGCDDPPSLLETRARDVALRFARLQKRWGPWGLAWWEALLRAADNQASRANDERPTRTKGHSR